WIASAGLLAGAGPFLLDIARGADAGDFADAATAARFRRDRLIVEQNRLDLRVVARPASPGRRIRRVVGTAAGLAGDRAHREAAFGAFLALRSFLFVGDVSHRGAIP